MLSSLATSQTSKGLGHVAGNTGNFIGLRLERNFPIFPLLVELEHQLPSFLIHLHLVIDSLQVISFGLLPYNNWGYVMSGITRALHFFQLPMYDSQIFGSGLGSNTNWGSDGPNSYTAVFSIVTVFILGVLIALAAMLKNIKTDDREIEFKVLSTQLIGLILQNWVYLIASVALIPLLQNLLSLAFCYYGGGSPAQIQALTSAMAQSTRLSQAQHTESPSFSSFSAMMASGAMATFSHSPRKVLSSAMGSIAKELFSPIPVMVTNSTLAALIPPTIMAINGTFAWGATLQRAPSSYNSGTSPYVSADAASIPFYPAATSLANADYVTEKTRTMSMHTAAYRHLLWFPSQGCGVGGSYGGSSDFFQGGGLGVFSAFGLALCIVGFLAVFPMAFFMNTVVFDITPTSSHPLARAHSLFDRSYLTFKLLACVLMHYFLSIGNAQSTTTLFKGSTTVTSPTGVGYFNQPLSNEDGHEVASVFLYYCIFIACASAILLAVTIATLPYYKLSTNKIRITSLALCCAGAVFSAVTHNPNVRHFFRGERSIDDLFGHQYSNKFNSAATAAANTTLPKVPLTYRQSVFFSNTSLPIIPTNPISGRPYYRTYLRQNDTQMHIDVLIFFVGAVLVSALAWFLLSELRISSIFKSTIRELQDEGIVKVRSTHFPRNLPAGDDLFEDFDAIVNDIASTEVLQDVRINAALSTGDDYGDDAAGTGIYHFTTPLIDSIFLSSDVELATRFLMAYKEVTNGRPFTPAMLAYAAKLYCKGIVKYRDSARVRLAFSYFLACFATKGRAALFQLQALRSRESSVAERFHAWRLYSRLANALHVNESVSLEAYTRAKRRHRDALQYISNFWQILVSDDVDRVALSEVTRAVQFAKKEVGEVYVLLLTKFAGHMDLVASFAQYCETMMLNPDATAQTLQCLRELRETKKQNAVRGARIRLAEKETLTQLPVEIVEEEEDLQEAEGTDSIVTARRVLWMMAIFIIALLLMSIIIGEVYSAKRTIAINTMMRAGELRSVAAECVVAVQNLASAAQVMKDEDGSLAIVLSQDYTTNTATTETTTTTGGSQGSGSSGGSLDDNVDQAASTTIPATTKAATDSEGATTSTSAAKEATSPLDLTPAARAVLAAKAELLTLHDDFRSLHSMLLFTDLQPSSTRHKNFIRELKFIQFGTGTAFGSASGLSSSSASGASTLNYFSMGYMASMAIKDIIVNPLGTIVLATNLTSSSSSSSSINATLGETHVGTEGTIYQIGTSTAAITTTSTQNKMFDFVFSEFPHAITYAYNRSIDYYAESLVVLEWECMVVQLIVLSCVIVLSAIGVLLLLYFDHKIEGIRTDIFSLFTLIPKRVCKRLHRDSKRRLAELDQFFSLPTKKKINYLIGNDAEEGGGQLGNNSGNGLDGNKHSPAASRTLAGGRMSPLHRDADDSDDSLDLDDHLHHHHHHNTLPATNGAAAAANRLSPKSNYLSPPRQLPSGGGGNGAMAMMSPTHSVPQHYFPQQTEDLLLRQQQQQQQQFQQQHSGSTVKSHFQQFQRASAHQSRLEEANNANIQKARSNRIFLSDAVFHLNTILSWVLFFLTTTAILILLILAHVNLESGIAKTTLERPLQQAVKAEHVAINHLITSGRGFIMTGERGYLNDYVYAVASEPDEDIRRHLINLDATSKELAVFIDFVATLQALRELLRISVRLAMNTYPIPGAGLTLVNQTRVWVNASSSSPSNGSSTTAGGGGFLQTEIYQRSYRDVFGATDSPENIHAGISYSTLANVTWPHEEGLLFIGVAERLNQIDFRQGLIKGSAVDLLQPPEVQLEIAKQTAYSYTFLSMMAEVNAKIEVLQSLEAVEASRKSHISAASTFSIIAAALSIVPLLCVAYVYKRAHRIGSLRILTHPFVIGGVSLAVISIILATIFAIAPPVVISQTGYLSDAFSRLHDCEGDWFQHVEALINYPRHYLGSRDMLWLYLFRSAIGEDGIAEAQLPVYGLDPFSALQSASTSLIRGSHKASSASTTSSEETSLYDEDRSSVDFVSLFNDYAYSISLVGERNDNEIESVDLVNRQSDVIDQTSTSAFYATSKNPLSTGSTITEEAKKATRRKVQLLEKSIRSFKHLSRVVSAIAYNAFTTNSTRYPLTNRQRAALDASDVAFVKAVDWDIVNENDHAELMAKYYLTTSVWYSTKAKDLALPTDEQMRIAIATVYGDRARDLVTNIRRIVSEVFDWLLAAATETYATQWRKASDLLLVAIALSAVSVFMPVLAGVIGFIGYTRNSSATLQRSGRAERGSGSGAAEEDGGAVAAAVSGKSGGKESSPNSDRQNTDGGVSHIARPSHKYNNNPYSAIFQSTRLPLLSYGVIIACAVTVIVLITVRRNVCTEAPNTLNLASERSWLVARTMAHASIMGSDRSRMYRSQRQLADLSQLMIDNTPKLYFKNGLRYYGALTDEVQDKILFARSNFYTLSDGVTGAQTSINSHLSNPYICNTSLGEGLLERVSQGIGLVYSSTWLKLTRQAAFAVPAQLPNLLIQMEYYYKALMLGLSISTQRYSDRILEEQTEWHSITLALTVVLVALVLFHHAVILSQYISFLQTEEASARLMLRIIPAEAKSSNPQIATFLESGKLMGSDAGIGLFSSTNGGAPNATASGRRGMFFASMSGSKSTSSTSQNLGFSSSSPMLLDPLALAGLSIDAQIAALSTLPVITIDQTGILIRFTAAAEGIFGYSAQEVMGRNVTVLMPPEQAAVHDSFLANYRRTRIPHAIGSVSRLRGMRKDGVMFPFELVVKEIKVSEDERYFVGIGKDLSTQMELDLQDRLTADLLSLTSDSVIIIDHHGFITMVNKTAQHIFGYSVDELVGENCKILMTPFDAQNHDAHLRRYRETGVKRIIDTTRDVFAQRKNGEVFSISLSVKEMKGTMRGEPSQFIGFIRDVTDAVMLETQTRASDVIASLSPAPVLQLSRRGVFLKFSAAAEKLFGYSSDELVRCGMNIRMLLDNSNNDNEEVILSYLRLIPDARNVLGTSTNIVGVRKNGEKIPIRISVTEVAFENTEPVFVVYVTDITQIQKAEAQMQLLSAMREWSVIPIVGTNSQGIIISFNNAACHAFKWTAEEVIGRDVTILMPPAYREHHVAVMQRFHASRGSYTNPTAGVQNYNVSVVSAAENSELVDNNPMSNKIPQANPSGSPTLNANPFVSANTTNSGNGPPLLSDWVRHETAICRDNTTFPVKIMLREVRDPQTLRSEVYAFIEDVTETRSTTQKLMVNEALLSLSPIPIIAIDGDGRIELFSAAAEACFGYSSIEVIGENITIIQPPEVRSKHDTFLQMFHKSAKKFAVDATLTVTAMRRNGSRFPCEVSVREVRKHKINHLGGLVEGAATTTAQRLESGLQNGEKSSFVAYLKEMSAEGQLLEAHALGTTVAALSPTPIIQATIKGIITYVNPAACREFRYEPKDLIGRNVKVLMEAVIADKHDTYLRTYEMKRAEAKKRLEYERNNLFMTMDQMGGFETSFANQPSMMTQHFINAHNTQQNLQQQQYDPHNGSVASNGVGGGGFGPRPSSLVALAMGRSARMSRSVGHPSGAGGGGGGGGGSNTLAMIRSNSLRARQPSMMSMNNISENSNSGGASGGGGFGSGGERFWREAGEHLWHQVDAYNVTIRSQAKRSDNTRFDVEIKVSEIPFLNPQEQESLVSKSGGNRPQNAANDMANSKTSSNTGTSSGDSYTASASQHLGADHNASRKSKPRSSIMTPLGHVDSEMLHVSSGVDSGESGGVGGISSGGNSRLTNSVATSGGNNMLLGATTNTFGGSVAKTMSSKSLGGAASATSSNVGSGKSRGGKSSSAGSSDATHNVELLAFIRNLDLQRRLEQANETIDVIVNMSIVPIVAIDGQGVVIIFSSAAEQAFEYRSEEVLGNNVKMLMPQEVAEKHDSYLRTYFKTNIKTVIGNVLRHEGMRKSGGRFPLELAVKEIVKTGHPTLFIAYLRPVANDTALEQATQLSQTIIAQSPIPVMVISHKGIIRTFNEAATALTGYSGDEVVGLNIGVIMEDEDARYHDNYLRMYAQTGIKTAVDATRQRTVKTKDGAIVVVSINVKEVVRSSGEVFFIGFVRDLTRDFELQTTSIVNDVVASLSPIPLICINDRGTILKFNEAAERDFRYSANEVLGQNVKILMPEDTAKNHDSYMARFVTRRLQEMQELLSNGGKTGGGGAATVPSTSQQLGRTGLPFDTTIPAAINGAAGDSGHGITPLSFNTHVYGRRRTGEHFPVELRVREVRGIHHAKVQNPNAAERSGPSGVGIFSGTNPLRNPSIAAADNNNEGAAKNNDAHNVANGGAGGDPAAGSTSEAPSSGSIFVGFIRDLSQHFEAVHYKTLYESAVDISPVPIISIQPDGAIITFNRAAVQAFKYTFEEVYGQNVRMLMPREVADKHDGYLNRYLQTGKKHILDQLREVYAKGKSGRKFPAKLLIKEIKEEDRHYFIANLTDISLTTALEHAWNINDCIIDMSDTAIACTDSNGLITKFSRVACEVFKCKESDVLGKDLGVLMTDGWRQLWSSSFVSWFNHHTASQLSPLIGIDGLGGSNNQFADNSNTTNNALRSGNTLYGHSSSTNPNGGFGDNQQQQPQQLTGKNAISPNFSPAFSGAHPSATPAAPNSQQGESDGLRRPNMSGTMNNNTINGGPPSAPVSRTLSQTLRCRRSDNSEFTAMLTINEIPNDDKDIKDPLCVMTAGSQQKAQALSAKTNGGFVVSIANYTEQAQGAEEDAVLAATEELAQRALLIINGEGTIVRLNNACANLFGYTSKSALLNRNVKMLMPDADAQGHDNAMRRYLKTGQSNLLGVPRLILARTRMGQDIQVELLVTRIHTRDLRSSNAGRSSYATAAKSRQQQHQHDAANNSSTNNNTSGGDSTSTATPSRATAGGGAGPQASSSASTGSPGAGGGGTGFGANSNSISGGSGATGATNSNFHPMAEHNPHQDTADLLVDDDPKSVLFLGVIENMHIKEELSYAPLLGPLAMRISPMPLVIINKEGTIVNINQATEQLFDFTQEQCIGKNVGIFMPSGFQKQHDRYLAKYLETGVKHVIDGSIMAAGETRSGMPLTLRVSVREFRKDNELYFVGSLFPLTDVIHPTTLPLASAAASSPAGATTAHHDPQQQFALMGSTNNNDSSHDVVTNPNQRPTFLANLASNAAANPPMRTSATRKKGGGDKGSRSARTTRGAEMFGGLKSPQHRDPSAAGGSASNSPPAATTPRATPPTASRGAVTIHETPLFTSTFPTASIDEIFTSPPPPEVLSSSSKKKKRSSSSLKPSK